MTIQNDSHKTKKIETDFFKQLDRFTFSVRKRVSTVYAGNRPSTRSGHGIDTIGFREYDSSDALKDIDWKAYARTEKLYVRQFEEEKNPYNPYPSGCQQKHGLP
ncbi:DUF58 domain-containing protein [Methanosarcina horonobensis]|uniref:DUF58 domain-containing protein n=1 Tax=Methanosarcina horonobensis TaxID=418008 RepID=UPI000AE6C3FD